MVVEVKNMPSTGLYLALTIIGFFLGVLWGALSISPYNKLKAAVAAGDADEANANAKKIRTYFIIGLVLNVLIIIGRVAGGV